MRVFISDERKIFGMAVIKCRPKLKTKIRALAAETIPRVSLSENPKICGIPHKKEITARRSEKRTRQSPLVTEQGSDLEVSVGNA
jgi:hypothetical protein